MHKLLVTVVVVVLCAPMLLAGRDNSERSNRRSQKQAERACQYRWGECVPDSGSCGAGKKTGTSDSADCPVKQTEKKCRIKCPPASQAADCKYKLQEGSQRSDCDAVTKKRPVTHTLVSGGESCQKQKIVYKPCRRSPRDADVQSDAPAADSRCKYRKGAKGECNAQTNTRTITLTLKRKSPSTCAPTKTIEKPCKVKPSRQEKAATRQKAANERREGRRNREQN